jgi:hypothetical protein
MDLHMSIFIAHRVLVTLGNETDAAVVKLLVFLSKPASPQHLKKELPARLSKVGL